MYYEIYSLQMSTSVPYRCTIAPIQQKNATIQLEVSFVIARMDLRGKTTLAKVRYFMFGQVFIWHGTDLNTNPPISSPAN